MVCVVADILECNDVQLTEGIGEVACGRGSCKSPSYPDLFLKKYIYIFYLFFLTTYSCSSGNLTEWKSVATNNADQRPNDIFLNIYIYIYRPNDIMIIKNGQKLIFPSEDKKKKCPNLWNLFKEYMAWRTGHDEYYSLITWPWR